MSAPPVSFGPALPHCTHGTCTSSRLPQGCKKRKCRRHCILDGPCEDAGHNNFYRSQGRRAKAVTIPVSARVSALPTSTPANTTPFDTDTFSAAFDGLYADARQPFNALVAHTQRETAQRAEDLCLLNLATGYKSPSPDVPVEHELEAHMIDQLAMQLSLAPALSLSLASSSRLPELSPSPDFPATLLPQLPPVIDLSLSPSESLPVPIPGLGRAQAPDATISLPRRRAPAPSTVARANRLPLRITTQLNSTWMGLGNSATAPASTSSSTLHVQQGGSRRPFIDSRVDQRFLLIYWDADDVLPQIIFVDSVPTWPIYILSTDVTTLQLLGSNISRLELFCPKYRSWLSITVDFVHQVVSDNPVFLCQHGVSGRDEVDTIERFLPAPTPAPHFRYNLADERRAVRTEYKKSGQPVLDESDSESEVEVVRETVDLSRSSKNKKRACQHSDQSSPPPQQRPWTATSPPSIGSFLGQFSLVLTRYHPTRHPHHDDCSVASWHNRAECFTHVFHREFQSSTYDDQVKRWKAASPSLQQKALKAGRTEEGSWSAFTKAVREEQEQRR
ncbi:hypothetical protein C8J57DRAFT_1211399 [Mycena rebaudengoi]|nr:hypothetical protein C8J57DRAFT_1211399 [Mycena rebaudengoi]